MENDTIIKADGPLVKRRSKYKGYKKYKKLGDLLKYICENAFYYDHKYFEEFIMKENKENYEALRILFYSMLNENIISAYEMRKYISTFLWGDSEEDRDVDEDYIANPILLGEFKETLYKLNAFKLLKKDSLEIDSAIDYLNKYNVNIMLKKYLNEMLNEYNGFFFFNHHLYFLSDDSKAFQPESDTAYIDHLYCMSLDINPYDFEKPSDYKKYVKLIDKDVFNRFGASKEGSWIYYNKRESDDKQTIFIRNLLTDTVFEFEGLLISYTHDEFVFLKGRKIYRVIGNEINEIYELMPYEYVDIDKNFLRSDGIVIAPVLRGMFMPYILKTDGSIERIMDLSLSDYIWSSYMSLTLYGLGRIDILQDCHWYNSRDDYYPIDEEYRIKECTINNIMSFFEEIAITDSELADAMKPMIRLLQIIGIGLGNKNSEISDFIQGIRNDVIRSNEDYWKELLSYSNDEQITHEALLSGILDNQLLGDRFIKFIPDDYVDYVTARHAKGEIRDYIAEVWFNDYYQNPAGRNLPD